MGFARHMPVIPAFRSSYSRPPLRSPGSAFSLYQSFSPNLLVAVISNGEIHLVFNTPAGKTSVHLVCILYDRSEQGTHGSGQSHRERTPKGDSNRRFHDRRSAGARSQYTQPGKNDKRDP